MKRPFQLSLLAAAVLHTNLVTANEVAPDDNSDIETISIHGTKLSTLQEDFAGTATVVTGEMAQTFGIDRLRDLDAFVPNMTITQLGQMGGSFISFRGISSNPFVVNRASVYIDGIPYREINNQLLNNIAQIEVLKGPQGSLYGSNTEAGVVIVNSHRPSSDLEADLSIEQYWHSNGNNQAISGSVSGGLIEDSLVGRVSFSSERGDAFVVNHAASDNKRGEIDENSVQTDLYWQPNDESFIRLLAMFERNEAPGLYEQEFVPSDLAKYNALYSALNDGDQLGKWALSQDVAKHTDEEELFFALSGHTEFSDLILDASFSYLESEESSAGVDLDFTAMQVFRGGTKKDKQSTYGEIRLSQEGAFSWLVGVNFYDEKRGSALGFQNFQMGMTELAFQPEQQKEASDIALFATASYEFNPDWTIDFGGRYEKSEQNLDQGPVILMIPNVGALESPAQNLEQEFEQFLPKVALSKRIDEHNMVYTSASKGWLPGGFNLAAARNANFSDYAAYDKETLWHYELGYKVTALDNRLFASFAAFYIDADNWQEYTVVKDEQGRVASTSLVTSDGSIKSKGFEAEFRYRATDRLSFNGGLGVVDAYYDHFGVADNAALIGNDISLTPKYDISLAVQYDIDDNWYVNAHANLLGQSYLNIENTTEQDPYALISMRAGYNADNWSMELFVKNLTNEVYYSGASYDNFIFGNDGLFYAPIGAPRQVGVRFDWFY